MTTYPNLFSPLKINNLMLKNRILAAPMGIMPKHQIISSTNYGNMSACDKALGGAALVHISNHGLEDIFEKYNRDVLREQISVIRQAGARCSLELAFFSPINSDGSVFGPIDGIRFDGYKMHAMQPEDMEAIIKSCAKKAQKARDFGFDMITFHFGHDSLNSQFLSPFFNTRTDEFGESLEIAESQDSSESGDNYNIKVKTEDPTIIFDLCAQFGRIRSIKVTEEKAES